jgi:periplasmic divalent cation tolerance protein
MAGSILLALCTFPDAETARKIVRAIVEAHLAACGNIVEQIESIYQWEGKIESSKEALAIFKLSGERYSEFEAKIKSLHPYDVPEIIAVPIEQGSPDYLRWVAESCA